MNVSHAIEPDRNLAADSSPNGGLSALLDRCVLCGLCLPHCPTYLLSQDENESPRGRISLIRGHLDGQLPASASMRTHLENCLTCGACERACPSGVRYAKIIESGRQRIYSKQRTLRQRLALSLVTNPAAIRTAAMVVRTVDRWGLRSALRRSGLIRVAHLDSSDRLLPRVRRWRKFPDITPGLGAQQGDVFLFTGCVARAIDTDTIDSAIRVLTAFGYNVIVPPNQTCCGGLHREAGDAIGADALLHRNDAAFSARPNSPVIVLSSGCASAMTGSQYASTSFEPLARRVVEIHAFLAAKSLPMGLALKPRPGKVFVHDPCSLRYSLRSDKNVYRLLEKIPQAEIVPLPGNTLCCGGAGSYPIRKPAIASRLAGPKVDAIRAAGDCTIVSANLGCALHLNAGLREHGSSNAVRHPITILDEQLVRLNGRAR